MIGYTFGLFDGEGKQVDQTSVDENDKELAMTLFKEFEATEKYKLTDEFYVELIDTEVDDYES